MNRRVFYFSLLALTISACSGVNNKTALGGFEYAEQAEAKKIVIPQGLDRPEESKKYHITSKINSSGLIGKNMDIRAPSLVLPVAASSRIDPKSEKATIWFDQVLDDISIQSFIQQAIEEHLASQGAKLTALDAGNNVYESSNFHNETDSGFLFFKSVDTTEELRFRYQLESKSHGRSVALTVELFDYLFTESDGSTKTLSALEKHRRETTMLNEIIAQVDYKYRVKQREIRLDRVNQKLVHIEQNLEGEPAYLVEMKLDLLWSNLPVFFEENGFTITDLDEGKKIYFVDFVKPDTSIWDTIWGDDVHIIDVEDAKYQFVLAKQNEKALITIYDAEGNALSKETLERIFPVMEQGLSF